MPDEMKMSPISRSTNANVYTPSMTPLQEAPATSYSPNPVSLGSSSTPAFYPLRITDLGSINTLPLSPSVSSRQNFSGPLTINCPHSAPRGSRSASGSSQGTAILHPTGEGGRSPTTSPQPISPPSGALLPDRKVNVGAVVGGVVLGVTVLLPTILLIRVLYSQRKRDPLRQIEQSEGEHYTHIIPFRVSVIGGRNDTTSLSLERHCLGAKSGDRPALLLSTEQQSSNLLAGMQTFLAREATRSIRTLPSFAGSSLSWDTSLHMLQEAGSLLEAKQRRRAHLRRRSTSSSPSPPLNVDFVRELAFLRAEVEQLRRDFSRYGELPSYTPQSVPQ